MKKQVLWLKIGAVLLLLINGLNALAAGYSFMADPDGSGLGMSTAYLRYSPFSDFFIPGLVLFVANGLCSMLVLLATLFQARNYALLILLQGVILIGWILVQIAMLRDFMWLHLACLVIGTGLAFIGLKLRRMNPFSARS